MGIIEVVNLACQGVVSGDINTLNRLYSSAAIYSFIDQKLMRN